MNNNNNPTAEYDNPNWAEVNDEYTDFGGAAEYSEEPETLGDLPPLTVEDDDGGTFDVISDDLVLEGQRLFPPGEDGADGSSYRITRPDEELDEPINDQQNCNQDTSTVASRTATRRQAPVTDAGDGIIQKLASAITETEFFARDAGDVYYQNSGYYRPARDLFVGRLVSRYLKEWNQSKLWTPSLAQKVMAYVSLEAPELWPRPPLDRLNTANGIVNVNTLELSPHSPEFLSTVRIDAIYDPGATCPNIDRFVREVFPKDAHHMAFEIAAWLMLPNTSIQKALLTIGEGANGKSVFLKLLQTFLGHRNVSGLSLHKIESDRFAAVRLKGKLANVCPDLPTATLSGTSTFKALTGGDIILGEPKHEMSFEFQNFARLVFSANSAPRSDDSTHGFFRRWFVVPFNRTFDPTDPNTVPKEELEARLTTPQELAGFLNRALAALPQIQSGNFTESESMQAAMDEFREVTDPLGVWLDSRTVEDPGAVVPKATLRSSYSQLCLSVGRSVLPESQFTKALKRLRPKVQSAERRIQGQQTKVFVGIGLLEA